MGFYGNITNTSKTNFVFDKIYSNRAAMDAGAATDGVFIGRYVLVEYGTKTPDSFIRVYGPDNDGWYYTSPNKEDITRVYYTNNISDITDTNIYSGMIIYIQVNQKYKYLICTGGSITDKKPRFEETNVETDLYFYNKNQDIKYQNSRGYDGTVWVKTSVEENGEAIIKYVNIAELNTVVPTFDIAYDAPTLYPITPHFDTDSNNVYYKLHMQPQWGLKVKKAVADGNNSDGIEYSSDETVSYTTQQYNPATDKNEVKTESYDGAIYYNKTGFNVENSNSVSGTNIISVMPTGKSGQEYNTHDNNYSTSKQIDTQEVIIQLPTIGNTISKVWDIVYDTTNAQSGRRFRDIEWKYTNDIDKNGDDSLGGMTRNLSTIAGCINSVHDLMGMIVYNGRPELSTNPDNTLIYFDNGKYYRIGIQYATEAVTEVHDGVDYFVDIDDQNVFASGVKWNNEVKTIPDGVHLVTRIEEPCWIEMDLGESLNTLHGWILQLSKYFCDDVDNLTRNRETVQGTINYLNDIIDKFDKLVPGEFVVVDEYGRMQSAGYTTAQEYESKNYGQSIEGTNSDVYSLSEDRWIGLDIDTKHKNPVITITHNFTPVKNDTTTTSDKNDPKGKNGINNNTDDELYLYAPIVDSTGHVVGKNIETVTLPYGYKTIKVTNTENTVVSEANTTIKTDGQSADNTQDILTLSASNRWIKLDNNSEDEIKIGHKRSDFVTGTNANTYYGLTQNEDHTKTTNEKGDLDKDNTFEVPCLKFDEAGHILEARTHTVTLPELFKKVIIGNENSNTDNTSHTAGNLEADTMNDNFTIKPGNKWIQMTADETDDAFSVQHYVNKFTEITPTAIDYNSASTKQFSIQAIDWDEAGHLTSSAKTTYTLPDGFKTITVANSGSSTTTFGTATNANLVAETLTDTATIDTGNRWLTLVADVNNDKVTLSHAAAGTASTSKNLQTNNNIAPNFGASFKVLTAGIDQAGHVKDLDDYSITLPKSSLAEGTAAITGASSASVVTGIVLENADTGKFTKTIADIGTLTLEGYALGTDAGALASSDTINGAMSKLQNQISNEVTDRENAIKALDVTAITTGTDKVFKSISETDGKVSADTQAVSDLTLSNYSMALSYTGIDSGNTLNTAFGQLEKGLAEEKARAQEEENKLSNRITAILDGVTETELNTLKEISDALQDDANYYATVNNAIAGVQDNLNKTDKNIKDNYYTKTEVFTQTEVQTNYILKSEVENNYVTLAQYNEVLERIKALEDMLIPPTETV